MTQHMAVSVGVYRDRLAFLRVRFAELREHHAFITKEYRAGRLSLEDELAQLADMMPEVYAVVAESVALTRSPALS